MDIVYSLDIIKYEDDLLVMVYADRVLVYSFIRDGEPEAISIIRHAVWRFSGDLDDILPESM